MYRWYRSSQICYVYLIDIGHDITRDEKDYYLTTLEHSRWWRRGWCLQELIAPEVVEFYDVDWREIGTKLSLLETISDVTGIEKGVLKGDTPLSEVNVSCRMSWAAERETTREEDRAYSLMGIFQVNMPLLYGEGSRAFQRLQEAIMATTEDYTLFARTEPSASTPGHSNPRWQYGSDLGTGLLASSPKQFPKSQRLRGYPRWPYPSFYKSTFEAMLVIPEIGLSIRGSRSGDPPKLTSRGLSMNVPVRRKAANEHQICLTCTRASSDIQFLCLTLEPVEEALNAHCADLVYPTPLYTVARTGVLEFQSQAGLGDQPFEFTNIYVVPSPESSAVQPTTYCTVAPGTYVTIEASEACTVVESHIFWHKEVPQQTSTNRFNLGPLTENFGDPSIKAVFAVDCTPSPDVKAKLFIAFGALNWNAAWCDVLSQQSTHKSGATNLQLAEGGDDTSDRHSKDLDTTEYERVAGKHVLNNRLFASPLSAAFSDIWSLRYDSETRDIVSSSTSIFKNRSDRAEVRVQGFRVAVSAKRTSNEHHFILKISTQPYRRNDRQPAAVSSDLSQTKGTSAQKMSSLLRTAGQYIYAPRY